MKALEIKRLGWNWQVEFAPEIHTSNTTWSSTPAFCGPDRIGSAIYALNQLIDAADYVILDDDRIMFRKEEDALAVFLKFTT